MNQTQAKIQTIEVNTSKTLKIRVKKEKKIE